MAYYILVEGYRTEMKVYPSWLSHLSPDLLRKISPTDVEDENDYYIISGGGYPTVFGQIEKSLDDIESNANFQNLVVIVDSEDLNFEELENDIKYHIAKEKNKRNIFDLNTEVIIQIKCMETWFLGSRKFFTNTPTDRNLKDYITYFDVSVDNPEDMGKYNFNTSPQFHYDYLRRIMKEKGLSYSKKLPREVRKKYFLDSLIERINDSNKEHLESLQSMLDFFSE